MRKLMTAAAIAGAMSLGACASAARSPQMVAAAGSFQSASPGQVGYKSLSVSGVSGGGSTNPLWMSNISANDFRSALETSLKAANYLADDPSRASVQVQAELQGVQRPLVGFDMSVTTTVRYVGTAQSNTPLFDKVVAGTGTAKLSDALIGMERVRIANENSAQENIRSFIQRLPELLSDLTPK